MMWPKFEDLPLADFPIANSPSRYGVYAILSTEDYERARRALAAIEIMERRGFTLSTLKGQWWIGFGNFHKQQEYYRDVDFEKLRTDIVEEITEADRWLTDKEADEGVK